jgi:hypothetical protein
VNRSGLSSKSYVIQKRMITSIIRICGTVALEGFIHMSLSAIMLFVGTITLSLWATMRVRQVYNKFSQLPASSGASGAKTASCRI